MKIKYNKNNNSEFDILMTCEQFSLLRHSLYIAHEKKSEHTRYLRAIKSDVYDSYHTLLANAEREEEELRDVMEQVEEEMKDAFKS